VLESSDSDLVDRIQNGQAEAESALYEKFSARVFYVALRASRSAPDAEDVRAETFLRAIQAIRGGQVRSAASLSGFVLGITRNVLNELFARRRRTADAPVPDDVESSAPSPDRSLVDGEVQRAVRETIRQLKPRERAVLRMHYFDELPTPEIARRTGLAPERVRLVKSRALQHFREVHRRLMRAARKLP